MTKKAQKNDLRIQAEEMRAKVRRKCEEENASSSALAIATFEQTDTAHYFNENARFITGLVVCRLEAVRKDEPTFPLGTFDAETLSRLLVAETEVDYDWEWYNEKLSDSETLDAWKSGSLILAGYLQRIDTPTTEKQRDLIDALVEYATAAAISARAIGSSSLQDWAGIIDILRNRPPHAVTISLNSDEALRLIELERSAANRLRLDKVIAGLPSDSSPKKKAKRK